MHHPDWGERPCRWKKAEDEESAFWVPDRSEIVIQYFTRYLFFLLSVAYFSTVKSVNDRYGHCARDRVLTQFARIFAECAEAGVCGRWGGDEFVAIRPPHDAAAVEKIFEQIDARIDAWSRSNALPLAASLGVAKAPQDGHDLVTLLSVADIHLYQSKSRQPIQAGVPAFIFQDRDQ